MMEFKQRHRHTGKGLRSLRDLGSTRRRRRSVAAVRAEVISAKQETYQDVCAEQGDARQVYNDHERELRAEQVAKNEQCVRPSSVANLVNKTAINKTTVSSGSNNKDRGLSMIQPRMTRTGCRNI